MADKNSPSTDFPKMMENLNGGVFNQKVEAILSECAKGVVNHGAKGKKGKVVITFDIMQLNDNNQVIISHEVGHATPTKRGKATETDRTETVFFVGKGGKMSIDAPKEEISGQFALNTERDGQRKPITRIK